MNKTLTVLKCFEITSLFIDLMDPFCHSEIVLLKFITIDEIMHMMHNLYTLFQNKLFECVKLYGDSDIDPLLPYESRGKDVSIDCMHLFIN